MAKKPKVKLAKKKVIVLCSLISGVCVFALAMSVILSQNTNQIEQESKKTVQIAEKPAVEIQKTAAPIQKQEQKSVKKEEPASKSKPAEKKEVASSVVKSIPQSQSSQAVSNQTKKSVETKSAKTITEKTANQQLASANPPRQEEQIQKNVPKNRFDLPPAANGATIVIVIDDAGRSVENTKRYAALPFPITIAVLPKLPQSRACADAIRAAGKELILHQPMQATNLNLDPGPGAIKGDMNSYQIASIIKSNLSELGPGVRGMNNHEGSLITSNEIKIGAVLEVCDEMGVYFLDSRTTAATKAPQAALERDMKIFEKAGPYLDNDIDRAKMIERMRETLAYANSHGRAIVIGHVDKSVKILPDLLAEMYPEMRAAGYRFATPSQLR